MALWPLIRAWAPWCVPLLVLCGSGQPKAVTPPRSGHPGEAAAAGVPEGSCLLATSSEIPEQNYAKRRSAAGQNVVSETALQFLGHRFVIRECYRRRKVVTEILLLITEIRLAK